MPLDFEFYRNITSTAYPNRAHWGAVLCNTAPGTGAGLSFAKDTMWAVPILITKAIKVSAIVMAINPVDNCNISTALYNVDSQSDLTPTSKKMDFGTNNASTANSFGYFFVGFSPARNLDAGFYWITSLFDVNHTFVASKNGDRWGWPALGYDFTNFRPYYGWSVARAFSLGLPSTFPASPTKVTGVPAAGLVTSC